MAKITNPLFSMSASGSIGDAVTFTQTARGAVAKRFSKPSGLPAAGQVAQRAAYAAAVASWNALPAQDKAAWTITGKARGVSGYNAYLSANIGGATPPHTKTMQVIDLAPWMTSAWFTCSSTDGSSIGVNLIRATGTPKPTWYAGGEFVELDMPLGWLNFACECISGDGLWLAGEADFGGQTHAFAISRAGVSITPAAEVDEQGSFVKGISSDGSTLLLSIQTTGGNHCTLYHVGGAVETIPNPAGWSYAIPYKLSADGETFVGYCDANGGSFGFIWTRAEGFKLCGEIAGQTWASATCISPDGTTIAGEADDANLYLPAVWDRAGVVRVFDLPVGESYAWINGVANAGALFAGVVDTVDGYRPTLWDANGTVSMLDLPAGTTAAAFICLSGDGAVAAGSVTIAPNLQPMIYK